jgi:amino acid transporter
VQALLVFYEVSGGPIGIEGAVGAGGPLLALLGFAVLPFVWSVPEALLTAELAVAFPENSGYVIWVREAFGSRAALVEGLLKWTSGVIDNAVYPLLLLDYLSQLDSISFPPGIRWLIASTLGVALAYLNWRGLEVVGRAAAALCVLSLLPFVVMILIGLPKLRLARLAQFQGVSQTDWPKLLNVLFWNLNYWEAVSTLAGEVHKPSSTFPKALLCASCFLPHLMSLALME